MRCFQCYGTITKLICDLSEHKLDCSPASQDGYNAEYNDNKGINKDGVTKNILEINTALRSVQPILPEERQYENLQIGLQIDNPLYRYVR